MSEDRDRPGDVLLRMSFVAELLGMSPAAVRAKGRADHRGYDETFPVGVRVGRQAIGYWRSEVYRWLEDQRLDADGRFPAPSRADLFEPDSPSKLKAKGDEAKDAA